jgi:hypothetical protein
MPRLIEERRPIQEAMRQFTLKRILPIANKLEPSKARRKSISASSLTHCSARSPSNWSRNHTEPPGWSPLVAHSPMWKDLQKLTDVAVQILQEFQ